ncbi:MAG: OmpP1/FadL family transporter [Prevotella sp.]
MNKFKTFFLAFISALTMTANAGGILTNTNQNIAFLRNPARDGAIAIDGVYSNPAGVVFLEDGFHLSLNIQNAHQTRTITSTNPYFALGAKNDGKDTKVFKGKADAPIIPSIQAAYNKSDWSFQFNFAITGGGGKCEFANGLGSFESVVGQIANSLEPLGSTGYDVDGYMQGRQYYYGFQLGAAYKVNNNLSVYGGLRLLYGSASYKAKLDNIKVNTANGYVPFDLFIDGSMTTVITGIQQVEGAIGQYEQAGMTPPAELTAKLQQLQGVKGSLEQLVPYSEGVNLMSDQTGWGVAPIIGIDYKTGNFNFAAKYEFKTRMRMKNKSTVKEASVIPAVNKFKDGSDVPEDSPALLALGAEWSITPNVRVNLGYHHFFDKDGHLYEHQEKLLGGDTNEYLGGAEWDVTKRLQVSGGLQFTRYQMTDEYMNDMSFVVNSYSFGFGLGYKISEKVKVNVAYFQTNYTDYDRVTSVSPRVSDSFTRTNRVIGAGVDLKF